MDEGREMREKSFFKIFFYKKWKRRRENKMPQLLIKLIGASERAIQLLRQFLDEREEKKKEEESEEAEKTSSSV